MMLCIDGSDIESVFFALAEREGERLRVIHAQQVPRRLGDELRLVQEFLAAHVGDVDAVGVVVGPGSSGALRSTLSLVNAWALGKELLVTTVERAGDVWSVQGSDKPFVLPVYERAAHTTPSYKDALGRRTSV